MRKKHFLSIILFTIGSCMALPHAWINEIHYDNAGTDRNEFVEVVVENPEQHYLGDLVLYMYNGYDGVQYCLDAVDEFDPGEREGDFQFYTWFQRGIQNDTEGMILVFRDTLIDILAYEGTFTGNNEPAEGLIFPDIEVNESGSGPDTCSIYLTGMPGSAWTYGTATPGCLNTEQQLSEISSQVELLDFNCDVQHSSVRITWRTASETEVIRFNLYKNGTLLTWLDACGRSSDIQQYEFIDILTVPGEKITYTLSETSTGSAEVMLDSLKVFIPSKHDFILKAPFPNPTNPGSVIEIEVFEEAHMRIDLFDIRGRRLQQLVNAKVSKGVNKIPLKLTDLPSGEYIIRCWTDKQADSYQLSVLK